MDTSLVDAACLLRTAGDVTLLGHVNPDADAAGTALALAMVLRQRGATVRVSFADQTTLPDSLRSLDPLGLTVPPERLPDSERLLVAVDTPTTGRLGSLGPRVAAARQSGSAVLVVDHHVSNTGYGTHNVVDTSAEASAVVAMRIIDELPHELDEAIASCLYAGLVTDTSSFRRGSAQTHRMAARLVDAGANPEKLGYELMDAHPFAWLPMLARVLGSARLEPAEVRGLGLVSAVVTASDAASVRVEEVESVVDVVRATKEAEVAVVLKEAPSNGTAQRWTVSLRARSAVDVSAAAQVLGGGGHRLAAGCTAEGTADEVLARLKAALADAPTL